MGNVGFEDVEFEELDHVAYRTETDERYEELKNEFKKISSNFSEVEINGRLITVYKLKEPVIYNNWTSYGLELCAPKKSKTYREGLEHAEFVIKLSFEEFMQKHQDIDFDMTAFSKEINPEIEVGFGDCAVKFHRQSLLEIRGLQ